MSTAWVYQIGPLGDEKRYRNYPEAFGVSSYNLFRSASQQAAYKYPKLHEAILDEQVPELIATGQYPTAAHIEEYFSGYGGNLGGSLIEVSDGRWYRSTRDIFALNDIAKRANVYQGAAPTSSPIKVITGELEIFLDPPQPQRAGLGWLALIGVGGLAWWVYTKR